MPKTQLPMTGGFYASRSLPLSNQRCSNLFVHINEGGGLANEVLFGTAGIPLLATSGTNLQTNRGSFEKEGIAYFVNGTTLFKLTQVISGTGAESFTLDSLGTVPGEGRVSIAENGTQLCILVPGGDGFIFDEDAGTPFQQIIDTNFKANGNPRHVVYIDGFFLFTTDTNKFIISALNNGLAYNALDFASAEADPDKIVVPVVLNNVLHIAGAETIEPFRNAAATTGPGFPFVRIEGGVESIGVFAAFSMVKTAGIAVFIGGSRTDGPSIYIYDGSTSTPISTDAIDDLLAELTETQLSNVFAWEYSQAGDRFVGFTLPTTTVVYEFKSQRWHERNSFDILDNVAAETRWRVNSIVKAYGRILVGDNIDGRVGSLDLETFDEYGQNVIRTFSTIPFSNLGNNIKFPFVELTTESGVGNSVDPDPMISMARSLDGKTFTPRRERSLGKVGEFNKRQIWRRNGNARRFESLHFTMSAKVKAVFIKLEADIL